MCSLEEAWSSEEFKNLKNEDCDPNYFCLPDNYFDNPQGLEKSKPNLDVSTEEENISNYNFNDDLLDTNAIQQKNTIIEETPEKVNEENSIQQEEPYMDTFTERYTNGNTPNTDNQDIIKMLNTISERIDNIEKNMKKNNSSNNNIHDVILFIIIGVFILFALDSIFKIGKMTI